MSKFIQCLQKNKVVKEALTKIPGSDFLSFESCLIVPVQRTHRYQLLIQDLLKYTEETHQDYPQLVQAVEKIKKIGDYVNERQRFYEGINQVLQLNERFGKQLTDGTGVNEFVRSHRRLLTESSNFYLFSASSRKKNNLKPVQVYLLTDLLLIGSLKGDSKNHGSKLYHLICLLLTDVVFCHDLASPGFSPFLSLFFSLFYISSSFLSPLLFSFTIPHPPSSPSSHSSSSFLSLFPFLILLPVPLTIPHPPSSPSYHPSSSFISLLPFLILLPLPLTIPHPPSSSSYHSSSSFLSLLPFLILLPLPLTIPHPPSSPSYHSSSSFLFSFAIPYSLLPFLIMLFLPLLPYPFFLFFFYYYWRYSNY